ncbi:MAG: RNA polymerase sigma factor [Peptococcaceae bacterium]|nr:RNA polymerase sigma factor [Peptococcaceae bacterium]
MKAETIVFKIKSGDAQAIRFVYELFYRPVYKSAYHITNDTGLAEDTVHEVFLKLPGKITQLEDPSRLEAWLCRMAANTARDIIRRRSRSTLFDEAKGIYSDKQLLSPETAFIINEEKQAVRQLVESLQPEYRQVLYLKYYREMSYEDISSALGVPVTTVKSRLFHARQEIKKLLEHEDRSIRHSTVKIPEEVQQT